MSKEYIIQDEPEYTAKIVAHEVNGTTVPMMHLDFKTFTPKAFKKLLLNWKLFRVCIKGPLYAIHNGDDDDKWRKFVERLGFKYFMHVDCPDGKNRRCFISQDTTNG